MNRVKSVMLLTLLSVILMAIGNLFGGRSGMLTMLIISLMINFYTYWNCDKIALRSYDARPLSHTEAPELYSLLQELSQKAGLPMPRLYVVPTPVPNAFATGRDPGHAAVAVTEGIVSLLSRDELAGVISHELSHVKHRDTLLMTLSASIAGAISYIANIAQWAAIFGGRGEDNDSNPLALIFTIVIAPLAAAVIQMALSRSREFMADESGAEISGKPLALASALSKLDNYAHQRVMAQATPAMSGLCIINPLGGVRSVMSNLFSTHPPTAARIARLQEIAKKMHVSE